MSTELTDLFPVTQIPYFDYIILPGSDEHAIRFVEVQSRKRAGMSL
jgi:hypothetical protein